MRTRPGPFRGAAARVALFREGDTGPAVDRWTTGAHTQARAANIDLVTKPAGITGSEQMRALGALPNRRPDAVLLAETSRPLLLPQLQEIAAAGIPLVGQEFTLEELAAMVTTGRDDDALTRSVLAQMAADLGRGAMVGLIAPTVGRPELDRRVAAWTAVRDADRWNQVLLTDKVAASLGDQLGKNSGNPALIAAALRQHPDVRGIFAVNGQLAADTVTALGQAGLSASVKVYAVVDDDLDPTLLSANSSPWVAAAMVDPAELAAVSVRAVALRLAGELRGDDRTVAVPGPLVTQAFLRQHQVTGLNALYPLLAAIPDAPVNHAATTTWLPNALDMSTKSCTHRDLRPRGLKGCDALSEATANALDPLAGTVDADAARW